MHIIANDFDSDRRGIEVFKFQLTDPAAIHGVRPAGIKCGDVKVLRAFADFFIRRKGDANIAVRDLFRLQRRQRRHDLCDARFIVGAEQRFTIGGNQGLA